MQRNRTDKPGGCKGDDMRSSTLVAQLKDPAQPHEETVCPRKRFSGKAARDARGVAEETP
jgi:hypothetical protein